MQAPGMSVHEQRLEMYKPGKLQRCANQPQEEDLDTMITEIDLTDSKNRLRERLSYYRLIICALCSV